MVLIDKCAILCINQKASGDMLEKLLLFSVFFLDINLLNQAELEKKLSPERVAAAAEQKLFQTKLKSTGCKALLQPLN